MSLAARIITVNWCPLPILHHEPYNTWESWHVQNVSSHLLQAGSAFCARPAEARAQTLAAWRAQLAAVQQRHRANNAFLVYSTAYEAPCKRLQMLADVKGLRGATDTPGGTAAYSSDAWRRHVRESQAMIEEKLTDHMERTREAGECNGANVTATDLVDAFANDTLLTLSMGKALLTQSVSTGSSRRCAYALPRLSFPHSVLFESRTAGE